MKTLSTIFFLFIFSLTAYSQTETDSTDADDKDSSTQIVQINTIKVRKRGVYKTYEEYLNDSPSVQSEFKVTPLRITKNNPLIAEALVDYKGRRPKNIWGISDGENVYIRVMMGQFFKNHYFKLQCDGPTPYIFLVEKPVFIAPGLGLAAAAGVAAGSALLPPFVTLSIVRDKTNYFKPVLLLTSARVKRNLADFPDLLELYKKEPNHNKATRARYITEFNKRKMDSIITTKVPSS